MRAMMVHDFADDAGSPRTLVIGAGGLGCPVLAALSEAAVACVDVAEFDVVDLSNLPRQWIYEDEDIGRAKAEVVLRKLPNTQTWRSVGAWSIERSLDGYARVIDGSDDVMLKFAMNDACVARGITYVSGGVIGFNGYALAYRPGETACLRCVFESPTESMRLTCRDAGVLAPLPTVVGSVMASLASERSGESRVFHVDLLAGQARWTRWPRRDDCAACGRAT